MFDKWFCYRYLLYKQDEVCILIWPYIADILQVLTDELSILVAMHSLLDLQRILVIVVYLAGSECVYSVSVECDFVNSKYWKLHELRIDTMHWRSLVTLMVASVGR